MSGTDLRPQPGVAVAMAQYSHHDTGEPKDFASALHRIAQRHAQKQPRTTLSDARGQIEKLTNEYVARMMALIGS